MRDIKKRKNNSKKLLIQLPGKRNPILTYNGNLQWLKNKNVQIKTLKQKGHKIFQM